MRKMMVVAAAVAGMAMAAVAMMTGVELVNGENALSGPSRVVAGQAMCLTNGAGTAKVSVKLVSPLYAGGRLVSAKTNLLWDATVTGTVATNWTGVTLFRGDFALLETTNMAACRVELVLEN